MKENKTMTIADIIKENDKKTEERIRQGCILLCRKK